MDKSSVSDQGGIDCVKTTVGDLIEAVTAIAFEAGKSEAEGYALAQLTLEHILRRNRRSVELLN